MKISTLLVVSLLTLIAASSQSQSILTTLYTVNGNANDGIVFDLNVLNPSGISITGFDINANTTGSSLRPGFTVGSLSPVPLSVYYKTGTYVGNSSVAAWTYSQSDPFTIATEGTPSSVPLGTPIMLPAGYYSIALGIVDQTTTTGAGLSFNNGTGTVNTPGSGNGTFANADLTLLAGTSFGNYSGTPGSGTETFGSYATGQRLFNGSIYYTVVPEPTALTLAGMAGLAALVSVRRKRH